MLDALAAVTDCVQRRCGSELESLIYPAAATTTLYTV
jgi:hypothetical protein